MTTPMFKDPMRSALETQIVQPSLKIAAAYARVVSLREQPSEYDQVLQIREFAVQYGFVLDSVYTDYGMGLRKPARTGLDALFQAAVEGQFQFIIMTNFTRMFRNKRLVEKYWDHFWWSNGIDFIFLDEVRGLLG